MKRSVRERWERANEAMDCGTSGTTRRLDFVGMDCWVCVGYDGMPCELYIETGLFHPECASVVLDGIACEDLP